MILVLVILNGILAGSEMAVVTARKGRLEALADEGHRAAQRVLKLRVNPERFLAAVQVGITLVGAIAGAFGGSQLADPLAIWLADAGFGAASPQIALALVVILITYLSVVFGELVPKSLALRVAERFALVTAAPLTFLTWIARPLVWLLTSSSNLVLRAFGDHTNFLESKLTREDLEMMLVEARSEGHLDEPTGTLLSRALEFTELRIRDVMVHRREVVTLNVSASVDEIRKAVLDQGHRRVPVIDGTIDTVVGYLLRDDVMACLWDHKPIEMKALVRSPFFLSDLTTAERALRELQSRKLHLAIVVDENGGVAGIVTLEDLVEELVGEIFHERDKPTPQKYVQERSGVWLVQGTVELRELERLLDIELPDTGEARTLGGLCVALAEDHIPPQGSIFVLVEGVRLEVVEATARRVRQVRVTIGDRTL